MNKKILLFTLVHPDFLPPVYAIAQVLRDLKYDIEILTFDSFVPAQLDLGQNIKIETIGKYYAANTYKRSLFRRAFIKRAKQLVNEQPDFIIAFCPFSFQCGLKIKKNIPIIYMVLELYDFNIMRLLKSPLSNFRNLRVLNNISKADLVSTPSLQRSAWLAGRCQLDFVPYTVMNTSYLPDKEEKVIPEQIQELIPPHFKNKKVILYTGTVNSHLCTMELIQAFDMANDENSALVITGIKDNEYCNTIRKFVDTCISGVRIKLLPYVTRAQMLSLQANAHIGVCLSKEYQNDLESQMTAPNKVGEYLYAKLYILGSMNEYLKPLQMMGLASLADTPTPINISNAIKEALLAVRNDDYRKSISKFVKDHFCMQQQLKPIINHINNFKPGENNN